MVHPTPQNADEMMRECLGTIARAARDIENAAMAMNLNAVEVHFNFLKAQMNRVNVLKRNVMVNRRDL